MINDEKKILSLCQDLIDIFTDYAFSLDTYFKDKKNKEDHLDLWNEYQILNINLKNAIERNGFKK